MKPLILNAAESGASGSQTTGGYGSDSTAALLLARATQPQRSRADPRRRPGRRRSAFPDPSAPGAISRFNTAAEVLGELCSSASVRWPAASPTSGKYVSDSRAARGRGRPCRIYPTLAANCAARSLASELRAVPKWHACQLATMLCRKSRGQPQPALSLDCCSDFHF